MTDQKINQLTAFLRRTTADLLAAEKKLAALKERLEQPIAVVGMACRLPGGAVTPEDYWRVLSEGRDAVGPFPPRWDVDALYDPDPEAVGKSVTREGGFLDDIDQFDAGFFGIPPKEAAAVEQSGVLCIQQMLLGASWSSKKASCIPEVALKLNVENEKKLKMNK